jgi:hypothetical protein
MVLLTCAGALAEAKGRRSNRVSCSEISQRGNSTRAVDGPKSGFQMPGHIYQDDAFIAFQEQPGLQDLRSLVM